jgi:hypothetical protein
LFCNKWGGRKLNRVGGLKIKKMDTDKLLIYNQRSISTTTTWLLFLFLGWSYGSMGQVGKQILFYLTLGGFGIWTLVRLFNLNGAIKDYNKKIAAEVGMDNQEMAILGLY